MLKDKVFWGELVATGVLGAILFFVLDARDIGQVTWIVGALLTYHKAALEKTWSRDLGDERQLVAAANSEIQSTLARIKESIDAMGTVIDLEVASQGQGKLRAVVDSYFRITDEELHIPKLEILTSAATDLSRMVQTRRSRTLPTAEYYAWLLPRIENASAGSTIWAISKMLDCEWDDSPEEEQFLELNLQAAQRGVKIDRLFVCRREIWIQAKRSVPAVKSQISAGGNLSVYFGDSALISRRDAQVMRDVGDGLIAFNLRSVLIDQHSDDGTARGYVTVDRDEVQKKRRHFDNLRTMCVRQSGASAGP